MQIIRVWSIERGEEDHRLFKHLNIIGSGRISRQMRGGKGVGYESLGAFDLNNMTFNNGGTNSLQVE